jgi:hypothetical protein
MVLGQCTKKKEKRNKIEDGALVLVMSVSELDVGWKGYASKQATIHTSTPMTPFTATTNYLKYISSTDINEELPYASNHEHVRQFVDTVRKIHCDSDRVATTEIANLDWWKEQAGLLISGSSWDLSKGASLLGSSSNLSVSGSRSLTNLNGSFGNLSLGRDGANGNLSVNGSPLTEEEMVAAILDYPRVTKILLENFISMVRFGKRFISEKNVEFGASGVGGAHSASLNSLMSQGVSKLETFGMSWSMEDLSGNSNISIKNNNNNDSNNNASSSTSTLNTSEQSFNQQPPSSTGGHPSFSFTPAEREQLFSSNGGHLYPVTDCPCMLTIPLDDISENETGYVIPLLNKVLGLQSQPTPAFFFGGKPPASSSSSSTSTNQKVSNYSYGPSTPNYKESSLKASLNAVASTEKENEKAAAALVPIPKPKVRFTRLPYFLVLNFKRSKSKSAPIPSSSPSSFSPSSSSSASRNPFASPLHSSPAPSHTTTTTTTTSSSPSPFKSASFFSSSNNNSQTQQAPQPNTTLQSIQLHKPTVELPMDLDLGFTIDPNAPVPEPLYSSPFNHLHPANGSKKTRNTFYRLHAFVTQTEGRFLTYTRLRGGEKWWRVEDEKVEVAELGTRVASKGVVMAVYRLQELKNH